VKKKGEGFTTCARDRVSKEGFVGCVKVTEESVGQFEIAEKSTG